eukprot:3753837-Pyramimonas_sp.AAC.1
MAFHSDLGVWHCTTCGFFCNELLSKDLKASCTGLLNPTRREYLRRLARGLWPKALTRAQQAARASGG